MGKDEKEWKIMENNGKQWIPMKIRKKNENSNDTLK